MGQALSREGLDYLSIALLPIVSIYVFCGTLMACGRSPASSYTSAIYPAGADAAELPSAISLCSTLAKFRTCKRRPITSPLGICVFRIIFPQWLSLRRRIPSHASSMLHGVVAKVMKQLQIPAMEKDARFSAHVIVASPVSGSAQASNHALYACRKA